MKGHQVPDPPGQAQQNKSQQKQPQGQEELFPLPPALHQQGQVQHRQHDDEQGPDEHRGAEQQPREEVQPLLLPLQGQGEHHEEQHHHKGEEHFRQHPPGVVGIAPVKALQRRGDQGHAVLFGEQPHLGEHQDGGAAHQKGLDELDAVDALQVRAEQGHAQGEEHRVAGADVGVGLPAPVAVVAMLQQVPGHVDVVLLVRAVGGAEPVDGEDVHQAVEEGQAAEQGEPQKSPRPPALVFGPRKFLHRRLLSFPSVPRRAGTGR